MKVKESLHLKLDPFSSPKMNHKTNTEFLLVVVCTVVNFFMAGNDKKYYCLQRYNDLRYVGTNQRFTRPVKSAVRGGQQTRLYRERGNDHL